MLEPDGKQHWHSRLLGKTDRRKVNAVYLSSRHAPLLPTSRQPEPNKGTASGLVVVREPYLGRVAAGRCLSVGLQVRGGGTPRRLHSSPHVHTAAADGRCRLGWTGGGSSRAGWLLCQQQMSVGPHHLQKQQTWEQGRRSDERADGKQQSKANAYSPRTRTQAKTFGQTDLAQLKMGWIQTTPNWSYKPV